MNKRCTKCKKNKNTKEFTVHKRNKDGLSYHCKKCQQYSKKITYLEKREHILKRNLNLIKKYPWRKTFYLINDRCTNKKYPKWHRYGGRGIKNLITIEELKELWFRDKAYLMKKPSIDREDNDGDYVFENCRYMELGKNSLRMNLQLNAKSVIQITLDGIKINEFVSISEATRQTGINNISKVLRGLCKTSGGYYWRLK